MDKHGKKQKEERCDGPVERAAGEDEPAEHKHDEGDGFDQAAAKVIEDLPTRDGADGIVDKLAGLIGDAAEEPLCDLPVSADPAMLAAGVGGVVRRIVVDDLDVGDEAGAGIGAFDEVVREEGVAGEAALEDLMENADLVDAFACEDALAEEVLIDVGDGAGIDVEASFAGVERGKSRARCRSDADTDAWLQDAVPSGDDASPGVDDGLIERVGDGTDHACRGGAGKLCIGIEGNDVTDVGEHVQRAGFDGEVVFGVQEKFVQVE